MQLLFCLGNEHRTKTSQAWPKTESNQSILPVVIFSSFLRRNAAARTHFWVKLSEHRPVKCIFQIFCGFMSRILELNRYLTELNDTVVLATSRRRVVVFVDLFIFIRIDLNLNIFIWSEPWAPNHCLWTFLGARIFVWKVMIPNNGICVSNKVEVDMLISGKVKRIVNIG